MGQENMREAARKLGWKLEPDEPRGFGVVTLSGMRDGVPVTIERRVAEYKLSTTAFIEPPLGVAFAITHQGIGGALANLLGFHDVRIGDDAFDRAFKIASADPDGIRRLLTAEAKTAIIALAEHARRGHLNPLGLREFQVTEAAAVIHRVVSVTTTTADDIVADIVPTVAVVSALRAASARR